MSANERQVGGDHYKKPGVVEHWDIVVQHELDYFQGQITKYVMRWKKKNGIQDLEKAKHFLEKYIEVERELEQRTGVARNGMLVPRKFLGAYMGKELFQKRPKPKKRRRS